MASRAFVLCTLASIFTACGADPVPQKQIPTADQARDYYGLGKGSCWRYRAGATFAILSVDGPDTQRVAGKKVWVVTLHQEAGGQDLVYLLDVDTTAGKMFLAQWAEGSGANRVTETYDTDPRPVFGTFDFDTDNKTILFAKGDIMETASTPRKVSDTDMPMPIQHKWVVTSRTNMVATSSGTQTAISMSYTHGTKLSTYNLVPGYGMASFSDSQNTSYQVCAAHVCDSQGVCKGDPDCTICTH
ncbi:MAG: hypothetical protein U1E65_13995 [Myxococcota bacterium]